MKATTKYEMIPQDQWWGWVIVYTTIVLMIISFCAAFVFIFIFPNLNLSIRMSQLTLGFSMISLFYSYWLCQNRFKAVALKC